MSEGPSQKSCGQIGTTSSETSDPPKPIYQLPTLELSEHGTGTSPDKSTISLFFRVQQRYAPMTNGRVLLTKSYHQGTTSKSSTFLGIIGTDSKQLGLNQPSCFILSIIFTSTRSLTKSVALGMTKGSCLGQSMGGTMTLVSEDLGTGFIPPTSREFR